MLINRFIVIGVLAAEQMRVVLEVVVKLVNIGEDEGRSGGNGDLVATVENYLESQ